MPQDPEIDDQPPQGSPLNFARRGVALTKIRNHINEFTDKGLAPSTDYIAIICEEGLVIDNGPQDES